MISRPAVFLALAFCALQAATAQTTSCRLNAGGSLVFAPYDGLSPAASDSLTTVQVSCTRNGGPRNVDIALAISPGNSGSVSARHMVRTASPVDYLNYGLFRDVSRSAVWGITPGVDTMTNALTIENGTTVLSTFTIYGRLPAQQNVYAGDYSDSVILTLTP